jgi:hypothetical protein
MYRVKINGKETTLKLIYDFGCYEYIEECGNRSHSFPNKIREKTIIKTNGNTYEIIERI